MDRLKDSIIIIIIIITIIIPTTSFAMCTCLLSVSLHALLVSSNRKKLRETQLDYPLSEPKPYPVCFAKGMLTTSLQKIHFPFRKDNCRDPGSNV
jgi:hypothetical protein